MSTDELATDDELVERHLAGETRAFDVIVARYERRVYAVALRMCGDPHDARDVSQEVFISAMRALRTFRAQARMSTWFHRIAVNASLDHLRKRRRRGTRPLDEAIAVPDPNPGPDQLAVESSRAEEVGRALRGLSDEHRSVVVLHDLEGNDYAEVADILGIPVGTVKSRLHRARLELAGRLGHLREQAEPGRSSNPLKER